MTKRCSESKRDAKIADLKAKKELALQAIADNLKWTIEEVKFVKTFFPFEPFKIARHKDLMVAFRNAV